MKLKTKIHCSGACNKRLDDCRFILIATQSLRSLETMPSVGLRAVNEPHLLHHTRSSFVLAPSSCTRSSQSDGPGIAGRAVSTSDARAGDCSAAAESICPGCRWLQVPRGLSTRASSCRRSNWVSSSTTWHTLRPRRQEFENERSLGPRPSAAFGLIGDEETLWTVGGDAFCLFPGLPTNECSHFARLGGIEAMAASFTPKSASHQRHQHLLL